MFLTRHCVYLKSWSFKKSTQRLKNKYVLHIALNVIQCPNFPYPKVVLLWCLHPKRSFIHAKISSLQKSWLCNILLCEWIFVQCNEVLLRVDSTLIMFCVFVLNKSSQFFPCLISTRFSYWIWWVFFLFRSLYDCWIKSYV